MGLFNLLFGKAVEEGVKEGLDSGLKNAFASEEIQLAYDKLMQAGYDLGRVDEKNNSPPRNFTKERHAKKGKR